MGRKKVAHKATPAFKKSDPPVQCASTSSQVSGISSERKRSKFCEGQYTFTCRESELKGYLTFSMKEARDRYEDIKTRKIIACKFIDYHTLDTLGLCDDVMNYIDNIGWQSFCAIRCPTYVELVREFYTIFLFKKPTPMTLDEPDVIQFRLLGKSFKLSITQFNIACGFIDEEEAKNVEYLSSACDFDPNFDAMTVYSSWANDYINYNSHTSKACRLHDKALKYLHKFLAYSYSGRKDSSQVLNKTEFFFLWSMKEKKRVNLGCWLAGQFLDAQTAKNQNLILGCLITDIVVVQGLLDLNDNNLHVVCEMQPLNLKCLELMGLIREHNGLYDFSSLNQPCGKRKLRESQERAVGSSHHSEDEHDELVEIRRDISSIQRDLSSLKEGVENGLSTMQHQLSAFFAHMGFTPPPPPA